MNRDSHPLMADVKFESGSRFYDKATNRIVWWCHYERSGPHYGDGRAMIATAKPGEPFTIHQIERPMGVEVRDMSIFRDDDGKAYLIAASNVPGQGANATLYVFSINDDFTGVDGIVSTLMENDYREAPHIVRVGDFYYAFFSQAAGWYPSRGAYAVARSLEGPWSDARSIGNTSTFSSQSGGLHAFGDAEPPAYAMTSYRWIRGEGTSGNVIQPVHFADGFAFSDYAPELLYQREQSLIVPLDEGRLLSQDRPVLTSIPALSDQDGSRAVDGSYDSSFEGEEKTWPFSLTIDLGAPADVRNVQVSWHLHKGSEAFYTYGIEGSLDGDRWQTLVDASDENDPVLSKTYGFTSDVLAEPVEARYVRLVVLDAHLHNNPNNWYPPKVYEVKVFGDAGEGS